jgi:hypothetical protein
MYSFALTAANIGGIYQPSNGNALYVFELPAASSDGREK